MHGLGRNKWETHESIINWFSMKYDLRKKQFKLHVQNISVCQKITLSPTFDNLVNESNILNTDIFAEMEVKLICNLLLKNFHLKVWYKHGNWNGLNGLCYNNNYVSTLNIKAKHAQCHFKEI